MSRVNFAAKRRLLALLVVAGTLGACAFGPKPNAELLELAQQATVDGRIAHADALYDEIARLCGFDDNHAVPASCEVGRDTGDTTSSPAPLGDYLTAVDEVPEESRDLVVAQAVDLAALDASDLAPASVDDPEDQELLREVLRQEHAAVYGLEASRAFASDPKWVDGLVAKHEQRVLALAESIPDAPVAEAGYTFGDVPLGDALIDELDHATAETWRSAAATASTIEARTLLVQGAGRAAQD